jgi:hypothetical protein
VTDGSPLSSAGYAGILTTSTTTTGPHLDDFSADDIGGGGGGSNVPLNVLVPAQGIFLTSAFGR